MRILYSDCSLVIVGRTEEPGETDSLPRTTDQSHTEGGKDSVNLPPTFLNSSEFSPFLDLTSAEAINSEAFPDTVLAQTDVGEPHP